MTFNKRFLPAFIAALTILISLSPASFGKGKNEKFPTIKIKNFGQMDDRFFRGGQPKENDYSQLAALGIKTVIDLQNEPTEYEKRNVEALGMKYVNIPMSDKDYPEGAKIEAERVVLRHVSALPVPPPGSGTPVNGRGRLRGSASTSILRQRNPVEQQ